MFRILVHNKNQTTQKKYFTSVQEKFDDFKQQIIDIPTVCSLAEQ